MAGFCERLRVVKLRRGSPCWKFHTCMSETLQILWAHEMTWVCLRVFFFFFFATGRPHLSDWSAQVGQQALVGL